jgi:hypothetical protein
MRLAPLGEFPKIRAEKCSEIYRFAGFRNRVSFLNLGIVAKIVVETRFLWLVAKGRSMASETGFLILNLGIVARAIAETRFLGLWERGDRFFGGFDGAILTCYYSNSQSSIFSPSTLTNSLVL